MRARKFTNSKDGIKRCDLTVTFRITEAELLELERVAILKETTVKDILMDYGFDGAMLMCADWK